MFPELALSPWRDTRDTLQSYCNILGAIRCQHMPRQRHWEHCSLRVTGRGLTTTPFPLSGAIVELRIDLVAHELELLTATGAMARRPLRGQSAAALYGQIVAMVEGLGHKLVMEELETAVSEGTWEAAAVQRYWTALSHLHLVFQRFKGEQHRETSPVQLWPHHFDLAMLLFSGRRVEGEDPNDEDASDEQMNFGFSTGDGGIPEPYFYITAWKSPDGLSSLPLPDGARWHTEGWTGAVLSYDTLRRHRSGENVLLHFFRETRDGISSLRRD
jgi:hypothetical protein